MPRLMAVDIVQFLQHENEELRRRPSALLPEPTLTLYGQPSGGSGSAGVSLDAVVAKVKYPHLLHSLVSDARRCLACLVWGNLQHALLDPLQA